MITEIFKAILFGIVEGITEWLPVSSTGHMILLDEFVSFNVSSGKEAAAAFFEMFEVVIQLGAIGAVLVYFFHKLNPFSKKKGEIQKKQTWNLWGKVIVAVLPSALLGLILDDWMDEHLYNFVVVAITLVIYGVAFIVVERLNKRLRPRITDVNQIDYRTALFIGAFQCLALIPGTSRSGATILGAILLGVSRPAAAEFSFFLAIPTMAGASALKLVKYLMERLPSGKELIVLAVGCVVAFGVSLLVVRGLMNFVRKRSFASFGVYRVILGVIVIGYYLVEVM